jgi:putative membrane protein
MKMNLAISRIALSAAVATLLSAGGNAQTMGSGSSNSRSSGQQGSGMSADAGKSGSTGLSAADRKFVRKAAQGGMAEVELGQLAAQKGSNDEVKQFGQRMVDDHTKANDQLKQVASSKGVDLPQDLDAKDKALKARLSGLSGAQFDKAYMSSMVKDHKKDVAEFQQESSNGKDSEVKSFASQTLPTLQDHLKQAQTIAPKVGATAGTEAQMSQK